MVSKVVPQKEEDSLQLMNQPIYQVLMLMTPEESERAADFQDLKLTVVTLRPMSSTKGIPSCMRIRRVGKRVWF